MKCHLFFLVRPMTLYVYENRDLALTSQVGGDGGSLHPQAAAPAAGTGVVGVQAGRPEARVLGLNGGVGVGEGAGVVEPHRRADPLRRGWRRAGEGWGLGPERLRLERADGWFVTVPVVGVPQR